MSVWPPTEPWYFDHPMFQIRALHKKTGLTGDKINIAVLDTCICPHEELFGDSPPKLSQQDAGRSLFVSCNHGTVIAAIIGGKNIGIAPKSNITNYIVGLDSPDYTRFKKRLEAALKEDAQIDILNISYSRQPEKCAKIKEIINSCLSRTTRKIYIVASAGDADVTQCPAILPNVISVGAIGEDMLTIDPQGLGIELDLVAPSNGFSTPACSPSQLFALRTQAAHIDAGESTSYSAPFVTGTLALLLSTINREDWPTIPELLTLFQKTSYKFQQDGKEYDIINPWKLITGKNPPGVPE